MSSYVFGQSELGEYHHAGSVKHVRHGKSGRQENQELCIPHPPFLPTNRQTKEPGNYVIVIDKQLRSQSLAVIPGREQ